MNDFKLKLRDKVQETIVNTDTKNKKEIEDKHDIQVKVEKAFEEDER